MSVKRLDFTIQRKESLECRFMGNAIIASAVLDCFDFLHGPPILDIIQSTKKTKKKNWQPILINAISAFCLVVTTGRETKRRKLSKERTSGEIDRSVDLA